MIKSELFCSQYPALFDKTPLDQALGASCLFNFIPHPVLVRLISCWSARWSASRKLDFIETSVSKIQRRLCSDVAHYGRCACFLYNMVTFVKEWTSAEPLLFCKVHMSFRFCHFLSWRDRLNVTMGSIRLVQNHHVRHSFIRSVKLDGRDFPWDEVL